MGNVKMPGTYVVNQNADILQVISKAGGFLPDSKLNNIYIYRKNSKVIEFNLELLLNSGSGDFYNLKPNDTIYIKPSFISKLKSNSILLKVIISFLNMLLIINN